ncbi:SpoIIE-like protein phosphatase domain protein [Leptospira fainei serovar Hurstbridge str. BUT 6]|uniref:SpoIIE-like protein phosphatase domain protein n=1 Tax=Leptospira fainei serovar Hurstbridge str. BUT 6 TaxID=1193011 RepID=S3VJ36_9LEPT|nr:SpoIIE family protein phosphatase [Leptospira fainei]EPG76470.1 SpoIIE-like protein phosphatase domain protein [Leptospira fainei serovar Hurstbridge str. BUT 6]
MDLKLTFFSFGSLTVCVFTGVLSTFLLGIPERSKSSTYLGAAFAFLSIHAFAFVIAYSLNSPIAAYHRWLILFVVPAFICLTQFFLHYPALTNRKFSSALLRTQSVIWLLFSTFYIYSTLSLSPVFDFTEQIWTFGLINENKLLGILILSYCSIMIFVGIRKSWVNKQIGKGYVTSLFLLFFILLIFPAVVANAMSRAGIISRATFLTIYTFFIIPGSFIILVLYINTTEDKTRFLNRITGICLGTFLLIQYWLSLASVARQEETFDLAKLRESENSVYLKSFSSEILYAVEISKAADAARSLDASLPVIHDRRNEFKRQALEDVDSFFPKSVDRFFLSDESKNPWSISYRFKIKDSSNLYEVGFPYESYRESMHEIVILHVFILFITIVTVLLGFRFFFKGTIWNPLKNLLSAIERINKGDLSTKIPVRIQDEIGFLSNSFNGMVATIRDAQTALSVYANTLEDQVKERTFQLTQLLEQQQGDYFLTSLLLKPFGVEKIANGRIAIESFIRQKKQFTFKGQSYEIGGDLCMADTLSIGGKSCSVFINADAMGKSIQGAGGAIVLGSIFGSILNRTKLFEDKVNEITPQRWLKSTFLELSKIFEIFDGTMLVTAVIGIVEEDTGKAYIVNAEHPIPILYRNGRASLVQTKHFFNRMGVPQDSSEAFIIQSLQLRSGDCLIIGSDGKDDLIAGRSDNGSNIINGNQETFLSSIEDAKGDLKEVYEKVKNHLFDDISILKIEYISDPEVSLHIGRFQKGRIKQ